MMYSLKYKHIDKLNYCLAPNIFRKYFILIEKKLKE